MSHCLRCWTVYPEDCSSPERDMKHCWWRFSTEACWLSLYPLNLCIHVCAHVFACECVYASVCVSTCVHVYACVYACVCMPVCVCMCVSGCMHMCVFACICICMHVRVCVCPWMCMCGSVYMCVYVCEPVYAQMCVYACVCVPVRTHTCKRCIRLGTRVSGCPCACVWGRLVILYHTSPPAYGMAVLSIHTWFAC